MEDNKEGTPKSKWIERVVLCVVVIFFIVGVFRYVVQYNEKTKATTGVFHPATICLGSNGLRKTADFSTATQSQFQFAFTKGCWTQFLGPMNGKDTWNFQQVGGDQLWQIYFMDIHGHIYGPFGWTDNNIQLPPFGRSFYIQAVRDNEKVLFWQ